MNTPVASVADIVRTDEKDVVPVTLNLAGQHLTLESRLRHFPGRRSVFAGQLDGRAVIAKLFAGCRRAFREFQQECDGLRRLSRQGVPGPELLYTQDTPQGALLIMDHIEGISGADVFPVGTPPDEQRLKSLLDLIRAMADAGAVQTDVHLDNFLLTETGWRPLDVAGMEFFPRAAPRGKLAHSLAALVAEFSPLDLTDEGRLLARAFPDSVVRGALARAPRARRKRLRHIVAKRLRNCTATRVVKSPHYIARMRRDDRTLCENLLSEDLNRLVEMGETLKAGNSATVARVRYRDRDLVIKRYNVPRPSKAISRQFNSHAVKAWCGEAFLRAIGIATPVGRMQISHKKGPLTAREYLITDFVSGRTLPEFMESVSEIPDWLTRELARFFVGMQRCGFSHGDTKWRNFLIHENRVWVIDLDSLDTQPRWRARQSLQAQRARFLRDWPIPEQRVGELNQALEKMEAQLGVES